MPKHVPLPSRAELEAMAFETAVRETMDQLRYMVGAGSSLMLCEAEPDEHFCTREAMTELGWVRRYDSEREAPPEARYITEDGITAFCKQFLAQDIKVGPVSDLIQGWFEKNPRQMNLFIKEIKQSILNKAIDG